MLNHYSPDETLVDAARVDAAKANEVFRVRTDRNSYHIKCLGEQTVATVHAELEIQSALKATGLDTAVYLQMPEGGHIGRIGTDDEASRFVISRTITGHIPTIVTPNLIESIGHTLGTYHQATKDIVIPPNTMQWHRPEHLQKLIDQYAADRDCDRSALQDLVRFYEYGLDGLSGDLPTANIHADLWLGNIFTAQESTEADDTVTALFDFDNTRPAPRVLDIGRSYAPIRLNTALTRAAIVSGLVEGYESATNTDPLTEQEIDAIKPAIAYMSSVYGTWHANNSLITGDMTYLTKYRQLASEVIDERVGCHE